MRFLRPVRRRAASSPRRRTASDPLGSPHDGPAEELFETRTGARSERGSETSATGAGWLLDADERGNCSTALPSWTDGNCVQPLLDGAEYLARLGHELARTGPGDLVLLGGWRVDADQRLGARATVGQAVAASAARGALVRGLVWHSHPSWIVGSWRENMQFARTVHRAGGRILLDQRIRPLGSHHQKFVVIRYAADPSRDVAFVGGVDLARSRADGPEHHGDPLRRDFAAVYGPRPSWHDLQVELRGPAVGDIEQTFRERWADPAALTRLPWQYLADRLGGLPRRADPLPPRQPAPPAVGRSRVQVLRTYPAKRPAYPFAPEGEYSVARALTKALSRAQRLVYLEDQYLWSEQVGRVLDAALRRNPELRIVAVCPRYPDQEGHLKVPPKLLGQGLLLRTLSAEARERVTLLFPEDEQGRPIYVHSKLCIIDDTWALVGSANLNRRSWSHDSELSVAVVEAESRDREGDGDGEGFALRLRLQLMREPAARRRRRCRSAGPAPGRPGPAGVRLRSGQLAPRWPPRPPPTGAPAPTEDTAREPVAPGAHRSRLSPSVRPGRTPSAQSPGPPPLSR